jgi:hypothetical protein
VVLMVVFFVLWGFNMSGVSSPPPPSWTGGSGSRVTCVEGDMNDSGNYTRLGNGLNERVQWHVMRAIPSGEGTDLVA